jgi:chemotaxis methyl-accepting protein methylase
MIVAQGAGVGGGSLAYSSVAMEAPPSCFERGWPTDVRETALQNARAGVYSARALHEVSSQRLQRFFTKQNDEHRVVKEVRDLCLFARKDVTHDPHSRGWIS